MEETNPEEPINQFADIFGLDCNSVIIDNTPVKPNNIHIESLIDAPLNNYNQAPRKWPSQSKYDPRRQTKPKIIRQLAHSRKNN